jgi:hypothetical protein
VALHPEAEALIIARRINAEESIAARFIASFCSTASRTAGRAARRALGQTEDRAEQSRTDPPRHRRRKPTSAACWIVCESACPPCVESVSPLLSSPLPFVGWSGAALRCAVSQRRNKQQAGSWRQAGARAQDRQVHRQTRTAVRLPTHAAARRPANTNQQGGDGAAEKHRTCSALATPPSHRSCSSVVRGHKDCVVAVDARSHTLTDAVERWSKYSSWKKLEGIENHVFGMFWRGPQGLNRRAVSACVAWRPSSRSSPAPFVSLPTH